MRVGPLLRGVAPRTPQAPEPVEAAELRAAARLEDVSVQGLVLAMTRSC